jgi:putative colanic acid biosysnthesis UDP-glucose lipid carrier transferase
MNNTSIRQHHSSLGVVQRISDVAFIGGSLYLSQWIVQQPYNSRNPSALLATCLIFVLCGEVLGIYRKDRCNTPSRELTSVLANWVVSLCLLAGVAFFAREGYDFARGGMVAWIILGGSSIALARMILRVVLEGLYNSGWAVKKCAIVGVNSLGLQLLDNIKQNPGSGLQLVGFFDDRAQQRNSELVLEQNYSIGRLDDLIAKAQAGEVSTVFLTLPMRAESRIRWLLERLADTTASVYIVPDFFVFELLHSRWSSVGGLPAVSVFETPLYGVDGWTKRVFDFAAALVGLIMITPIMLLVSILVKLTSPGPVFFRQKRYGLDGKQIWVWKFRSMRTCDNGPVVQQATKQDSRLTPIGGFLRRSSLDELPQLFNVLDGSMSLVGPRPHASAHNEHYRKLIKGYMLRHKVKPGITGLAQVEGFRGETDTLDKMQKRVDFDHRYIREWSLWLDVKILLRTLGVVAHQKNAY